MAASIEWRLVTTYSLRKSSPDKTRADLVVIGLTAGPQGPQVAAGGEPVADAWGRTWTALLSSLGATGKAGEALRLPTGGKLKAAALLLVGLGSETDAESLRRAAGVASRNVGNAASVVVALPAEDAAGVRAVTEGWLLGGYSYRADGEGAAEVAFLTDAARQKEAVAALEEARLVSTYVDQARTWVNTPPNQLRPPSFADEVAALHKREKRKSVTLTVLDEKELADLGCGGILGVGGGSEAPPRLVKLEYRPKDAAGHVALVGKGITFDSGGLSIKPSNGMATMKMDMAGAASVVAATYALAALEVPVAVTAYAPMAENMVSGEAMRPGDVITMYGGRTVEVHNTDAEGRLVMADALAMAAETDADVVLDIATLTGACILALGDRITGVFGDDDTTAEVLAAAERSGEPMWRLPVPEATRERIRTESQIADLMQHIFVRWGSASWAAGFVWEFAGDKPFAHLDIAGPAWNGAAAWGHTPAGATGAGIRTLIEVVRSRAER
ncbi:leucyl aminopeptidase [Alteromonas gracilis]